MRVVMQLPACVLLPPWQHASAHEHTAKNNTGEYHQQLLASTSFQGCSTLQILPALHGPPCLHTPTYSTHTHKQVKPAACLHIVPGMQHAPDFAGVVGGGAAAARGDVAVLQLPQLLHKVVDVHVLLCMHLEFQYFMLWFDIVFL